MPRISQLFAKSLAPTDRDVWHWDDTLKGFAIRQRPGIEPQFWVRYQVKGASGKRKHLIGPCSLVKAEKARDMARDILEQARLGIDFNAKIRDSKTAKTIADLEVESLEIQKPPAISTAYYRDKKTHWKRHITPGLGAKTKIKDISRADVIKFHNKYSKNPALGNSLLATLSKAMSFCIEMNPPWRTDNPCAKIKKFTVKKRETILSKDEVKRLSDFLNEQKLKLQNGPLWSVPWLIQVLLLTGLRLREVANRKWTEIDLDIGVLTIPKPKGKKKERHVTLSTTVTETLRSMPRRSEWVFPNSTGSGPFLSPQKHWESIRSELGLDGIRLHDLRHTVASYAMHDGGLSQREVMELLGHSQMSTTERYLNVHDERKRGISDRASSAISKIAMDQAESVTQKTEPES